MDEARYVFAGNRAYVLERMLQLNLNIVKIWAVKNSYLQRYLEQSKIQYSLIEEKEKFFGEIEQSEFDFFISNGLPIILPIERLKMEGKRFINIHPSLLPDLRGKDPVPGAILFHRDSGATCHMMDGGIDTGDIISQIKIENSENMDAGLLYQLSFMAEADVFEKAYMRNFLPTCEQISQGNEIYYSFQQDDLLVDLEKESPIDIIAKVKAFSTRNKGARITIEGHNYKCYNAEIINNSYCDFIAQRYENLQTIFSYENVKVVKVSNKIIKFTIDTASTS